MLEQKAGHAIALGRGQKTAEPLQCGAGARVVDPAIALHRAGVGKEEAARSPDVTRPVRDELLRTGRSSLPGSAQEPMSANVFSRVARVVP
jgi:hypothetical protein